MAFMSPNTPEMTPPKKPKTVAPPAEITSTKPKRQSMQTTFIGADSTPDAGSFGQKTLIGQ